MNNISLKERIILGLALITVVIINILSFLDFSLPKYLDKIGFIIAPIVLLRLMRKPIK